MHLGIDSSLDKIYMPRRYGGNHICLPEGLIAATDIRIPIPLTEGTCPPLAMALVLRSGYLLIQIADICNERDMAAMGDLISSAKREGREGGAKDYIVRGVGSCSLHPLREFAIAIVCQQRPKRLYRPLP